MSNLLATSIVTAFNHTATVAVALSASENPTPFPSPQPPDDHTPDFLINFLLTILFSLIAPCFVCQWYFQKPVGFDEAVYLIYVSIFAWTRIPEYAFRATQSLAKDPAFHEFWSVYMMHLGPIIGLEGLFSLYHAWSYHVNKANPPLTTRLVFLFFRLILWVASVLCCVGPLMSYLEYRDDTVRSLSYILNVLCWALYEICCVMFLCAVICFKVWNGTTVDDKRFYLLIVPGILFLWDNTYQVLLAFFPVQDFHHSFYIMTTIPEIIICCVILFANVVRRFKFDYEIPMPGIPQTFGEVWVLVWPKKISTDAERQPLLTATRVPDGETVISLTNGGDV
jgi:hypothetical protein